LQLHCQFDARHQKNLTNARVTVFAGINQVSASLSRFKPHVWQKQVFAGRNPTLFNERSSHLGSESPALEIDVYVWCYAVVVVHARNE